MRTCARSAARSANEGYLGQVLAREAPDGSLAAQDAQLRDELAAKIANSKATRPEAVMAQEFAQRENNVKTAIRSAEGNLDKLKQRARWSRRPTPCTKAQAQIASSHPEPTRVRPRRWIRWPASNSARRSSRRASTPPPARTQTQSSERSLEDKLKASGLIGSGPSSSDDARAPARQTSAGSFVLSLPGGGTCAGPACRLGGRPDFVRRPGCRPAVHRPCCRPSFPPCR